MAKDSLQEQIAKSLRSADPERLKQIIRGHRELEEIKANLGPRTKEELWEFFKEKYGIELGTVAVCPGHVSQIDLVWEVYNFMSVLWVLSRGYGKCVAAGTMIYDASSGRRLAVEEVCDGRPLRVAAMTEEGDIEAADAFGEPQGLKPCLRLTTRTGRSITLSHDHPLLTSSGWIRVDYLEVGQHIALPRVLPEPDWIVPFGDGELDMLAVLLAEGCYTCPSVMFSTGDPRIVEIMQKAVEPYGCRVVHSSNYDYRVAYSKGAKNPIRRMLDSVGIGNEGARTKRLPDIMWSLSNEEISRFLGVFWMCDGYVQAGGPHVALASERLVRDIARLLLRLGIQSIVSQKRVKLGEDTFQSWILSVRGTCFKRFFERVPLWGDKHDRMAVIAARQSNANLGRPAVSADLMKDLDDAIKSLSKGERAERGRRIAEILGRKPHGMFGTARLLAQKGSSKTFSTSRFRAAIDTLPDGDWFEYEYLGSEDLWWDEIVSIENAGDLQTYDICVPDYGNFVADDILVHNTSLMALTDDCQATHFPGWNSFTIGPGRDQGERKYEHLLPYVIEGGVIGGKELQHVQRSTTTKTEYKNGSKIEISLGGDPANANGPRAARLHRDEIELMLSDTRKQAVNIPAGKKTRDGRYVPAQTVDTSTMKWAGGYVHLQIEEYLKTLAKASIDPTQMDPIDAYHLAIERGHRPNKAVRISCLFEVTRENPYCRSVPDEQRIARLVELDLDPEQKCPCHTYTSDVWDTDDPAQQAASRTLEDVCQGRFFRSRGHKEFSDVVMLFLENDRATWEAEQECSEPSREGAYLKAYSQDRHGIRGYEPDPENGPIYTTTDWGAADEHWTGWFQELEREVVVRSFKGERIRILQVGSKIAFAEFFRAQIGNIEHGQAVLDMERQWVLKWPGWRVTERYYDNANLGAKLDWEKQLGMQMMSRIRKDFGEELKMVRTEVSGWGWYVDIVACPVLDESLRGWRQVNGREVHNQHSHAVAGCRYYLHNRHVVERALIAAGGRPPSRPAAGEDHDDRAGERVAADFVPTDSRLDDRRHGREMIGAAGAEDSPLRAGSGRVALPLHRSTRPR